ncbi:hypothetical protein ACH5RR_036211 [Cinchona calisaya]|uniref:Uncharacterized protein n=1 Tax=Cinchona calisaya TaxID=153742 RepID=A0ABD2Y2J3_9GENT
MINCDDKLSPKVALGIPQDKWFEARTIDISNSIIRIHDPVLQQHLDNRSCESFNFDMSFSKSPFISYTILQNITLFKCKFSLIPETRKKISDLFSGYDNYDLCNNLGYTIYYQNPKYHVPGPAVPFYETSQLQCTTLNLPMVSKYNDSVKPGFFELLTAEFDLQWNLSDDCNRSNCYSEGHICRTNCNVIQVAGYNLMISLLVLVETDPFILVNFECRKEKLESHSSYSDSSSLLEPDSLATSIGGFVILVTIAFCFWRRFPFMEIWMKPKKFQNIEAFLKNYGSIAPKRYYYSEVKKMTNSFKIKLG